MDWNHASQIVRCYAEALEKASSRHHYFYRRSLLVHETVEIKEAFRRMIDYYLNVKNDWNLVGSNVQACSFLCKFIDDEDAERLEALLAKARSGEASEEENADLLAALAETAREHRELLLEISGYVDAFERGRGFLEAMEASLEHKESDAGSSPDCGEGEPCFDND